MVTAEELRAARAILQMDQAELAKISGVSVETIKRLERQTGKLHAKIETIIAIRKAFEARHLEFLGNDDGRGAGVRLVQSDKLQILREALIGKWSHMMDQWIKAQCATDPRFFEHNERRLIEVLINLSTRMLPAIVHSVLSDVQKGRLGNLAALSGVDVERYREAPLVRGVTDLSADNQQVSMLEAIQAATPSMSAPERAIADASYLTPQMLAWIDDPSDLGSADNRYFVDGFVEAIPVSERGTLTRALGDLSAEGMIRARNAVLVKAYGHADIVARITESTDDGIKSISDSLVAVAPEWAAFRARIRPNLDVMTPALMQAVKVTADIRSRGQTLNDYFGQQSDKLPDAVRNLMGIFYDGGGRRVSARNIVKTLRLYLDEATKGISNDSSRR